MRGYNHLHEERALGSSGVNKASLVVQVAREVR